MLTGPLLLAALLATAVGLMSAGRAPRLWLGATLLACAATAFVSVAVLGGAATWEWRSTATFGGQPLHLRLDAIAALFLLLLSVVGGAGAVYARDYWSEARHPRSARAGRIWWSVLLLSLGLVLLVSNGLHFLLAWELFAVSAYFLITLDRSQREVRAAGWLYLGASHAATLALFAFFTLLASRTGSWDLGPLRDHADLAPLFWLALFGFGLKAGVFPLHVWLPSAHASAPSHVSALLSGVTIKMGIYGLVRFSGWLPVPVSAGWIIAALGVGSAVLGVAFALGQHDLKRLLAYHSVENIGIILIGLGLALIAAADGGSLASTSAAAWGRLALAGALLHVWNHGLFKSLLFLGAGSVVHATGTREMSRLGGLWRTMPWTAALFALGAAAISGLPPLNGFVSEWLVFLGLFDATIAHGPAAWAAIPAAILLGVTGALALACFVKVCGVVFLGAPRTAAAARAHECGPAMRGPMLVLAGACVALGLAPFAIWPALARAAGEWHPAWSAGAAPASLVALGGAHVALALLAAVGVLWLGRVVRARGARRAPTWDCGYALPSARMQYTAGSFAATITEWFDGILRPVRHALLPADAFPVRAAFETHTPETVLEHVVVPAAGVVMQLSAAARRWQHGRLQSYLLYLVAGLAALAALVATGIGQ